MPFSAKWRLLKGVFRAGAILALTLAGLFPALAADSANFGTRAKAAVLIDADTGAILFQHNADELLPPASITKLMTVAMVFKAIKDNRLKLSDEIAEAGVSDALPEPALADADLAGVTTAGLDPDEVSDAADLALELATAGEAADHETETPSARRKARRGNGRRRTRP